MSDSMYLYQSVPLSPSSQSVPSPSSHSLLTSPSSSLPFHNISSSVPSTALDILHFLKHFTNGEICCHAIMTHNDWILHLYFLVYQQTWTHEDSQFSPQMELMVLRILNTCVLDSLSCLWSDQSEFMPFLGFIMCGLIQVLFLSLVVNF